MKSFYLGFALASVFSVFTDARAEVLRTCTNAELIKMGTQPIAQRPIDEGATIYTEISLFNSIPGILRFDVCASPNKSFYILTQVFPNPNDEDGSKTKLPPITLDFLLTSNNRGM